MSKLLAEYCKIANAQLGSRWNGYPDASERSGWHWVDDADGLRPLLWRGDDWPEKTDRGSWEDRYATLSASDLVGWTYYGVATIPNGGENVFRSRIRVYSFSGKF